MMDERDTDRLLSELFKRNAPYVNERATRERIAARLPRRRRRRRRTRIVRAVAVGLATVVVLGGFGFGVFRAVDHFQSQPDLVISDFTSAPGDTSVGAAAGSTSVLAGLLPVVGTATLDQVKSEGSSAATGDTVRPTVISGRVVLYSLDMSQRGVSGTLELTSNLTVYADGSADIQGSWVLTSSQGSWKSSSWIGHLTPDGAEEFGFGHGTGAVGFEGLDLYLQWHSVGKPGSSAPGAASAGSIAVTGWVQSVK